MSAEAPKPEVATQSGSDQFVEGHHPTDRVRPFKHGDLPDVYEDLLARGVPTPTDIHPLTLEAPVDKIAIADNSQANSLRTAPAVEADTPSTPAKPNRFSKRGIASITAAGLTTAIIGGLGAMKLFDDEREVTSSKSEPTVSALPESGEKLPESPSSPQESVGTIINNDLESLNAYPSQEVIELTNQPISAELPAKEAALIAGDKLKAFYLSGDEDIDAVADTKVVALTAESVERGNEMLRSIFSTSVDVESPSFDWLRGTRANTASRLAYYGTDEQYNVELGKPEYATSDTQWTVLQSETTSPTAAMVSVEANLFTNFEALDRDGLFDHSEVDTNQTFFLDVNMVIENGEWRIQSLVPTNY